jgi:ribonuclease HI
MRVFTDGACTHNGRPGAKAGFAVWFPDHPEMSCSHRVPDGQSQTNQRAELSAIQKAIEILDSSGLHGEDLEVYTDSKYSIDCLTNWLPGWIAREWKTADGKDVLHQDLIKDTTARLSKFKSYRFIHVKAHTGGADELSRHNDRVDRMARATLDETVRVVEPPALDDILPGCPLRILGPPVAQTEVLHWIRENVGILDREIVDKYLMKAFAELCKRRDVTLAKQTIARTSMLRAERSHLQIDRVVIEKLDE